MALFDSFPYSNLHELNLDWIIETIRSYDAIIDEFKTFMSDWAGDRNALIREMQRIEQQLNQVIIDFNNSFETFTNSINTEMSRFEAAVNTDLVNQRLDYTEKIQALDDYTQGELADYFNRYSTDFNTFTQSVITYCDNLNHVMTTGLAELKAGYEMGDKMTLAFIDSKLERFIDDLVNLYPPVYNPVKGFQTSLQTALDDLYNMFAYLDGWTCRQWDSLNYTAQELDDLNLSAYEHDTQANNLDLRSKLCQCSMISPFTGIMTRVIDVINTIVDTYRTNTLTAGEFDAKELTAGYLDELDLTAYELDYNSALLIV